MLATLERGEWIAAGQPVVLLGDSGTGKSHLLIGLGIAACQRGLRVRYTTAAALVNELAEAAQTSARSRAWSPATAGSIMLCLDEFGYVHLDPRGAELLFQVLTEREERASVAVASNAPFSEWGQTFADPRLAAAVVDRLTFHAHIIETGSDSYRLRVTTSARGRCPDELITTTGWWGQTDHHGGARTGCHSHSSDSGRTAWVCRRTAPEQGAPGCTSATSCSMCTASCPRDGLTSLRGRPVQRVALEFLVGEQPA